MMWSLFKRSSSPTSSDSRSNKAKAVDQFLQVVEVGSASPFIQSLFMRRFGGLPPDFPRHFVAIYSPNQQQWESIGYVHHSAHNKDYLCGGLVMDDRVYRRVEKTHREQISAIGGIAELLLLESIRYLGDCETIWGYVGDKQAKAVDLRVGFEETHHPYLMAIWNTKLSKKAKRKKIDHIATLGPF